MRQKVCIFLSITSCFEECADILVDDGGGGGDKETSKCCW
jgi:hypothetical protein